MKSTSSNLPGAAVAFLAVALAICWQWTVVQTVYGGNWTGLFCAGERFTRPPEIQRHEFVFHASSGYDGQFYQLVAHDPLLQRHYDGFLDAPRLRYRRILMPGLAYVFAAGQPEWIDAAYIAIGWLFVGLGTFCLAELAACAGRGVWWGMLFFIMPATLMGLDRETVDIALSALIAAVLLAARKQNWVLLWLALAGAVLSKETGALAVVGVVVWLARQRRFGLALVFSSSLLPATAWWVYVQSHTAGDYSTVGFGFVAPFFVLLKLPLNPGIPSLIFRIAAVAAVAGLLWAAIRSVALAARDHFRDLETLVSFCFAALLLLFETDAIWGEPDGFPRIYSPLLVCLIAATWRKGFGQTLMSFGLAACPICMQWGWDLVRPLLGAPAGR